MAFHYSIYCQKRDIKYRVLNKLKKTTNLFFVTLSNMEASKLISLDEKVDVVRKDSKSKNLFAIE